MASFVITMGNSVVAQNNAEESLTTESGDPVQLDAQGPESEHPQYDSMGNLVQETRHSEVVDYEIEPEFPLDEPGA